MSEKNLPKPEKLKNPEIGKSLPKPPPKPADVAKAVGGLAIKDAKK